MTCPDCGADAIVGPRLVAGLLPGAPIALVSCRNCGYAFDPYELFSQPEARRAA